MTLAVAKMAIAAEDISTLDYEDDRLIGDVISRLGRVGHDFYRDLYYPIGGLRRLLKTKTTPSYLNSITINSRDIETCVNIMRFLNYHVDNMETIQYRDASINKII